MAVIGGNTVYHNPLKFSCVPESFWEGFQSDRTMMVWVSSIMFMTLVWRGAVASQQLTLLLTINSPWGDNVGFQFNSQRSFPRKVYDI